MPSAWKASNPQHNDKQNERENIYLAARTNKLAIIQIQQIIAETYIFGVQMSFSFLKFL